MQRKNGSILAWVLAAALCLSGCAKPQANAEGSVGGAEEGTYTSVPSPSESTSRAEAMPDSASLEGAPGSVLGTWEKTCSGDGELHYAITKAHIVSDGKELDSSAFFETAYVCRYGAEEPVEYFYPEFIGQSGSFVDGIKLIVLDITVSNPEGATNRYEASQGNWVDHFTGNPYLFTAGSGSVGLLLDLNHCINTTYQMYRPYPPSYFSGRNGVPEREDGFILKPGETISFQLGYLICNNEKGEEIDVTELAFGTSNSLKTDWVPLGLKELFSH